MFNKEIITEFVYLFDTGALSNIEIASIFQSYCYFAASISHFFLILGT